MANYQALPDLYGKLADVEEGKNAGVVNGMPATREVLRELIVQAGGNPNRPTEELRYQSQHPEISARAPIDPNRPQLPMIESFLEGAKFKDPSLRLSSQIDIPEIERSGYDAFKSYATAAPGSSAWEKLMLERAKLEEADARDRGARTARTGATTAYSDLARTGGVSSGARERLGRQSALDLALLNQQLTRDASKRRYDIGTTAEANRVGALTQLPGAERALTGQIQDRGRTLGLAKQFDIQNVLRQKELEDRLKMGQYEIEMKDWAAGKQAGAIEESGKK